MYKILSACCTGGSWLHIVNEEGKCTALRLKHLLAGPSLVCFVQSYESEWCYPLLKPYKHYIPVGYGRAGETVVLLVWFCKGTPPLRRVHIVEDV